jgi:hypothetical protein
MSPTAGLRGPGRLRLLPRGGRRPHGRPLRARAAAWKVGGIPATSPSAPSIRPTGTAWSRSSSRDGARPRHPRRRHPHVLLRARVLHPRPRPAVGEAPGIRGYFVCAGLNSDRHPLRRRHGPPCRALDHVRSPRRRRHRLQRRSVPGLAARSRCGPQRTSEVLGTVYAAHAPAPNCAPAAASSEARCTTSWSPRAPTSRMSPAGNRRLVCRPRRHPDREPVVAPRALVRALAAEHEAVRTGVGLIDMSFMAKFIGRRARCGQRFSTESARAPLPDRWRRSDRLHPVAQ